METQAILNNSTLTKTEKIRQLLALGLTRREVANLTGGNYGFVQNVFARYWPEQVRSRQQVRESIAAAQPGGFSRRFGIEIEAYNVDRHTLANALQAAGINIAVESYNHTTRNHWKLVTDASIRGPQGFELVSPVLEGEAGLQQVETVCRVLAQQGTKVNKSCGLHLHINANRFSTDHVKNLIFNYAKLEGHIDAFMPRSRRANNNGYCLSTRTLPIELENCQTVREMANRQTTRYQKINLQAFTRHGSIEFRQHSGTIEFEKINNWVRFIDSLITYSEANRVTEQPTFETLREITNESIFQYISTRKSRLQ